MYTHTHATFHFLPCCNVRDDKKIERKTKGIYCIKFIVHMLRKHKKYVQWHFAAIRIVIVVLAIVVVVGAVVITVVAGAVKHLSQGHSAKYSQNSFWLMNYEWADDLYGPLCTVLCPLVARRNNICLFIYFAFHLSFFSNFHAYKL